MLAIAPLLLGLLIQPHATGSMSRPLRVIGVHMAELVTPSTIADVKRAFEANINKAGVVPMSVQAFVNEVASSSVTALATPGYTYTRVFGLGLVSLCDEFLFEARDDASRDDIRDSLCKALGYEPSAVVSDAESLLQAIEGRSEDELLDTLDDFKLIAGLEKPLKYTYTLGAGLIVLMRKAGLEPDGSAEGAEGTTIERWCARLNLPCARTLSRDYAYYQAQVDKAQQVKDMFAQMKGATDRRLAAQAEKEEAIAAGVPRELMT
uniref:Uncharacterized protein n=1 Tax=Coccolithus braarudii TaxID=221442 RepID=A0A7S0LAY6_9EUKA